MSEDDYIKEWKDIWENFLPNKPFQKSSCLFHLGKTFLSEDFKNARNLRFCLDDDKASSEKFDEDCGDISYDFYMPTDIGYVKVGFDYDE